MDVELVGEGTTSGAESCNYKIRACIECLERKPLSDFTRNRFRKDGHQPACKDCMLIRVRRSRGVAGPLVGARPSSDDRCGICGGPGGKRGLFLDHDHHDGHARGWLCARCNSIIGMASDDPQILERAIRYLRADDE